MPVFLITFKPATENRVEGWPLAELQRLVVQVQQEGKAEESWRFSNQKDANPGDVAYLLLQGRGGPAIIGKGALVTKPAEINGRRRATIRFTSLVDPAFHALVTKDELTSIPGSAKHWKANSSGTAVPKEVGDAIESAIQQRLARSAADDGASSSLEARVESPSVGVPPGVYAAITENDESQWSDDTGVLYHFPRRYAEILSAGARVVYYKGKQKGTKHADGRLSVAPHYFGLAVIGKVYPDPSSSKGDLFATVDDYAPFFAPVLAKTPTGQFLEAIPASRSSNYWRDGVRSIDEQTYQRIRQLAGPIGVAEQRPPTPAPIDSSNGLESGAEGNPSKRYVTVYERDPRNRKQAIAIHGLSCRGCGNNLGKKYGPYAEGLIHVHHIVPVSTFEAPRKIDPATELVPVCPSCHAVIHRKRTATLSIEQLKMMFTLASHGAQT